MAGCDMECDVFFIGSKHLFNVRCCFRTLGCDSLVTL